jgi:AraC-like DNA-binding protein
MLDRQEKMRIVGSVINTKEKPEADDISAVIEELWLNKEKITIGKIASTLNTSRYLISYYFDDEISESIKKLNQEIRDVNLMSKAIEAIDELTDKGNRLKMRQLKKLTSIRDYALLKQAVIQYQNQV